MRAVACAAALAAFLGLFLTQPAAAGSDRSSRIVELGRRLFMDPTVSRSGRFSCASCHDPEHGFSDARRLSADENGETRRHSQPLLDLRDGSGMHWDGEFDTVKELLVARLDDPQAALDLARDVRTRHFEAARTRGESPHEGEYRKALQSLTPPYYGPAPTTPNPASRRGTAAGPVAIPVPLLLRLRSDDRYAEGFVRAFGSRTITVERVITALDAYVQTIRSGEAPYDRYLAGDPSALTPGQRRGLALFEGKANCAACHTPEGEDGARPLFRDDAFHNTGVTFKAVAMAFDGGLAADGGLGEMDFVRDHLGRFKTPSLRDVARRPPYMHDGSLATLQDVVRYYDRGGTPNLHLDAAIRPLHLDDAEVGDLVAFLEALSSDTRPALGPARAEPQRTRLRVVDLHGKAMGGLELSVRPCGDRLAGATLADSRPQPVVTDANGWVEFEFPPWTHVRLTAPGHEIQYDWPIPDYVTRMEVMAAPKDTVALKLTVPGGATPPAAVTAHLAGDQKSVVAVFKRVRSPGGREAVYVAAPRGRYGQTRVWLDYRPNRGVNAVREMDLSGGWTEPLDLRPAPEK